MKKFVEASPLSDPETAARKLIEIANGVEEPGEYRCPICSSTVDKVTGSNYVAYRLTVRPEWAIIEAPQTPTGPTL